MNLATGLVLALLLALCVMAIRKIRREKLLFSCGGDCAHCAATCRRRS
ncbi:MAG: FeoB-associated Cys-rich membrane protein [Clostridia bacterium]|nr:FeoB-associated Cys-rich membrane protein [Clostridia bacterium]